MIVLTEFVSLCVCLSVLQPLSQLTTKLLTTYKTCNPSFAYTPTSNPRRVLTKPEEGVHNSGYDNTNFDLILYVNDVLESEKGTKYAAAARHATSAHQSCASYSPQPQQ